MKSRHHDHLFHLHRLGHRRRRHRHRCRVRYRMLKIHNAERHRRHLHHLRCLRSRLCRFLPELRAPKNLQHECLQSLRRLQLPEFLQRR